MIALSFLISIVLIPLVLVGFAIVIWITMKGSKGAEAKLRAYANANNLTFCKGLIRQLPFNGLYLNSQSNGNSQYMLIYPDGTYIGDCVVTLATEAGGVMSSYTLFVSCTLEKFQNIQLIVHSNDNYFMNVPLMAGSDIGKGFVNLILEGDFPSSFNVKTRPGQEIDALQALNPGAMAKLVDLYTKYDIELACGRLFLYRKPTTEFYDPAFRQLMIQDAHALQQVFS